MPHTRIKLLFSKQYTMLVLFVIGVLFLNPTFSCANSTYSPLKKCWGMPKWHMFVTNDMVEEIKMKVHLESDYEFPTADMPPGHVYDWYYCQNWKWWYGDFVWGSRNFYNIMLWSKHIYHKCFKFKFPFGTVHCYWSVRPEGFYVSKHNSSFPGPDWHFEGPWPEPNIM